MSLVVASGERKQPQNALWLFVARLLFRAVYPAFLKGANSFIPNTVGLNSLAARSESNNRFGIKEGKLADAQK